MGFQPQGLYPKEKIHLNVARLKKAGMIFEVVLKDPEKAYNLRRGKQENILDIINSEHIFIDAKKGEFAPEPDLKRAFSTEDHLEVAKAIIMAGEINLTVEFRNKLSDAKKKKIIEYIHQNAFDPKTKLPHPMQRIENAIEQAKISINPDEDQEFILKKVIEKLKAIIPISFEKIDLTIQVPRETASPAFSAMKRYGASNESWKSDGSVSFELSIAAGKKSEVYNTLNKITSGNVMIQEKQER